MKNSLIKKVFGRVSIAHGIIILLTLVLSTHSCTREKPFKLVTSVGLQDGPAPASASEPEATPEPAPEIKSEKPKPEPKPEPKPKPEKKMIPKPVATNKPPETVKTNAPSKKAAVTNTPPKKAETSAPAKPKTEAEKLAAIRQNKKVSNPNAAPAKPALDFSGLKSALNSAAAGSGPASGTGSGSASGTGSGSGGGMYSPFAGYYDSVKQQMYGVWQQPAGAPIGLTAIATIRVERNGIVSLKSITRRSGNVPFDQSVQNALNATTQLPVPPPDLPSLTIEIEFVLSD